MLENIATNAELLAPSIVVSALLSLLAQADTAFDAAVTMSSQLQRADVQQYLSSQRHHLRFLLSVLTGVEDARLPLLNGLQLALHPPSALASAVVAEGGLSCLATLLYLVNVQVVSAAALCLLNASAAGTADAAVRFDNALVHALVRAYCVTPICILQLDDNYLVPQTGACIASAGCDSGQIRRRHVIKFGQTRYERFCSS